MPSMSALQSVSCLAAACALVASCGGPVSYPAGSAHGLLGKAMPEIHRDSLRGKPVDTRGAGVPVVVKFFAKSCAPCRTTLPAAQKLHEAYDDVAFIGISMDDSEDDTRAMVAEFGLTFPV